MSLRSAKRVRVHFFNDKMPSVEGLLLSRRHGEYAIGVPELVPSVEGNKVAMGARIALFPRENVWAVEEIG